MSAATLSTFLAPSGLLQSLIDQSALMVLVLDEHGECVFSSRAGLGFRGRTLEQDQGRGWMESVHSNERSSTADTVQDAVRAEQPFALMHRMLRADGTYRCISTQGLPWFDAEQVYLGHVVISVDVTAQRPGGIDPPEEPRPLQRLIEKSHDMVYRRRFFPTNSFDYIGGAVVAITGRTAQEFYENPGLSGECVHPDDRHLVPTAEMPTPVPPVAILRWIHADGRVVHAEHRRVPIYDEAGHLVAVEGIARDISEVVEAQRRLRESEEQLRLLAARMHDAREAERAKVARELHDELGQTLTALKLDIGRMVQILTPEHLTPPIVDRLQSLIGLSDIGLATVKRIATTLRPPTLDHLGLAEAIHWESVTFKARSGLRCTVRTNKTRSALTGEQQTALFRIFQEAMTNIVRHAQASAVHVTLTEQSDRFEMSIRDNGRGITEAQTSDPSAIGLLGMRERTALMGGTFRIVGRRGKGTVVSIEVPVAAAAADAQDARKTKVSR